MKRFSGLKWRNLRARPLRTALTALGVVLGVALVLGVLTLSGTLLGSFEDLFDSVYGRADLVVSGKDATGTMPGSTLERVRGVEGVVQAQGNVFAVMGLVGSNGRVKKGQGGEVNTAGVDPRAEDLTDSRTVAGRDMRSGREIELQESFAADNRIEVGDRIRLAAPTGVVSFKVVGLWEFPSGLTFGGQGFAAIPLDTARRVMDRPRGFDEVQVVVGGGDGVEAVERRLRAALGKGVTVETPQAKTEDIQAQLQGLNVFLYFFAGMALFVGGFLIFNSFSMTVLARTREIGMLRTLGAPRRMIVRSILGEALVLGVAGSLAGLALGAGLAALLIALVRQAGIPVGGVELEPRTLAAAVAVGIGVTAAGALLPARRAGRVAPVRAVLGVAGPRRAPRMRRAVAGAMLVGLGLAGVFVLASASETPLAVVAAGIAGVIFLFLGVSLVAPFVIGPLVRVMSWPVRRVTPVEGRLAADSARANPGRTAATTTGLMIGLALVTAFASLGSSFLGSISDEFDRRFVRDFTIRPVGFQPGFGPQRSVSPALERRVERLAEAGTVTPERMIFQSDLIQDRDGLVIAYDPGAYPRVDSTEFPGRSRSDVYAAVGRGAITLGSALAKPTGLQTGDTVTLRGPSGTRRARVASVVDTVDFGGATIGMSLETARDVYGVTHDSQLAIKAASPDARKDLEREIERILARYPQLQLFSNEELKSEIESAVNQQFSIFYAILAVAIIVSLLGVINTLSMNVFERTREIGVLRALGSSRWQVRRMIADESLLLTLVGTLLGLAIGVLLGRVFVEGMKVAIPSLTYKAPSAVIIAVAVVGVLLGLLAAVLPARRAARMNVIEAIGYE